MRRCALLIVLLVSPTIQTDTYQLTSSINIVHYEAGNPWLAGDWTLDQYAQAHAERMAAAGHLYHSNIYDLLWQWSGVAENVGYGPSIEAIVKAFFTSPTHALNMTAPYTHVGVGMVWSDGRLWVAVVFAK